MISSIEDNTGGSSSIRVLMLVWGCGIFVVWAVGSIFNFFNGKIEFISLPTEAITVLFGITGLKVGQRFVEKPDSKPVS